MHSLRECREQMINARFSLLHLFEIVTLIAITIAVDRLLSFPYLVWGVMAIGGLTGAYLAIRWTSHRPRLWSDIRLALGYSAAATCLNATAFGIVIAEQFRAVYPEYFNWALDGVEFALLIGQVTLGGAVIGAISFTAAKLVLAPWTSPSKR